MWDPVWGTRRDLPAYTRQNGTTTVDLEFAAAQSFFVVFRRPAKRAASSSAANFSEFAPLLTLDGPWTVHFDTAWGGPAQTTFVELTDWSLHPEAGIRYYSGTAVYRKPVSLSAQQLREPVWLDTGVCHNIAEITVNGTAAGVLWTAPWQIDISRHLRAGANLIEIAVTNTWANRLIGDEQEPADIVWEVGDAHVTPGQQLKEFPEWFLKGEPRPSKGRYTFVTWNYFNKDSKLVPAGLLGPVRLLYQV